MTLANGIRVLLAGLCLVGTAKPADGRGCGAVFLGEDIGVVYGGVESPFDWEGHSEVSRTLSLRLGTLSEKVIRGFNGTISSLRASPTLKHLAIIHNHWPASADELSPELAEFYSKGLNLVRVLHVIEVGSWKSVAIVPGVQRFSWAPSGRELAVIRGVPIEKPLDISDPRVERVTVDGSISPIEGLSSPSWDLEWSKHDGRLRLLQVGDAGNRAVVAFDLNLGQGEVEESVGLRQSPSGRFSIKWRGETPMSIVDASGVRSSADLGQVLSALEGSRLFEPLAWAGSDLLVGSIDESTVVWDLRNDMAARTPGRPCHVLPAGDVLVLDKASFKFVELLDLRWEPALP